MPGIRQSDDLVHFIATFYDSSKFWEEVRELQEDIEFFSLYIRRNKKSNFNFSLQFYNSYRTNFLNGLWNSYGWVTDKGIIEWIYGLHIATEVIINNYAYAYNATDDFISTTIPHELIYKIMKLIYDYTGLNVVDFVRDFIDDYNMYKKIRDNLSKLYYEYDNITSGGNEK